MIKNWVKSILDSYYNIVFKKYYIGGLKNIKEVTDNIIWNILNQTYYTSLQNIIFFKLLLLFFF